MHAAAPSGIGVMCKYIYLYYKPCHNASMKKEPEMKDSPDALKRRYQRLLASLAKLGPILQGTITERTIERPAPERPAKKKTYGPYYQWTWKREGKTVTVNLSPSQAKTYQRAIDRHRKLEGQLEELRDISLRLLEATTEGVARRKRND